MGGCVRRDKVGVQKLIGGLKKNFTPLMIKQRLKAVMAVEDGNLFQFFPTHTENAQPLYRRRLGPCNILQVCLLDPGWGGRRKKGTWTQVNSSFGNFEDKDEVNSKAHEFI